MKPFGNNSLTVKMRFYVLLMFFLHLTNLADASIDLNSKHKNTFEAGKDTLVKSVIRNVLKSGVKTSMFQYPKSLKRFYSQAAFQPVWITSQKDPSKIWDALMLLDCVSQFGLNHADYHPKELSYATVYDILEKSSKVDADQKAWFDMLLSDALITFINHLHFGKLNPVYTKAKVDQGNLKGFSAEDILIHAMKQNDFTIAVLNVQPKVKEYQLMQGYMKLIKGQFVEDCYEVPEGLVKKVAINMERLRWAGIHEESFIQMNIPSYALKLQMPDTTYLFKVIVGKPESPTPISQHSITHILTAPDWKVPAHIFVEEILPKALKNPLYLESNHYAIYDHHGKYVPAAKASLMRVKKNPKSYYARKSSGCGHTLGMVVFKFQQASNIDLHGTPDEQVFAPETRALSHGCISVQHAEKLAGTLLVLDGQKQNKQALHQAIAHDQRKNFNLRKPVPLKITYLTCEIGANGPVEYEDIYKLDKALELAFYNK